MTNRYGDNFSETKAIIYDLFNSRHNRCQVWYENLLDIALGLYLIVMMAIIEAAAVPARAFNSLVQRAWGATFGRIQLPQVKTKVLWFVFGGFGALVIGLAIWYAFSVIGGK